MQRQFIALILFCSALALASPAWAAIGHDTTTESTVGSAVSTRTFNATVSSGTDRMLVCGTGARGGSAANLVTASITYNGVGLTKVREDITGNIGGPDFAGTSLWRLVAPATGTLSVVVTYTGSVSNIVTAWCTSFNGVDQTTPIGASNGSTSIGSSTPITVTVTSTTNNSWVIDSAYSGDDPAFTVGAGQVARSNRIVTGGSTDNVGASTNQLGSIASINMIWTPVNPTFYSTTAMTINPSGTVTPPSGGVGTQFNGTCNTISWNANTESDLAGYRLYDRVSQSVSPTLIATFGVQITSVSCASLGFNAGQHYVTLRSFDTTGNESAGGTEVPFFIIATSTNQISDLRVTAPITTSPTGLGVSSVGKFTINGVETFLLGFSGFDALQIRHSDMDTFSARGFNLWRAFVNWEDNVDGSQSVCIADGSLNTTRRDALQAQIDYAKTKTMIVELVILSENSDDGTLMTTDAARKTCVTNVVNYFKPTSAQANWNVIFDVWQEHTVGTTTDTFAKIKPYTDAGLAACPTCIIFAGGDSSVGKEATIAPADTTSALTTAMKTAVTTKIITHGETGLAVHDFRSSNWFSVTGARVAAYRAHLISIGRPNIPLMFTEPNRYGFTYGSTEAEFNQAAGAAKAAGAAAWVFHHTAYGDASALSIFAQLNATETAITNSMAASLPNTEGTTLTLAFTEVDGGDGLPATYDIRIGTPTINWGTDLSVTGGTCSTPVQGFSIGATRSCTVTGLSLATGYQFQLVPYRGTLGINAIFGPLSNIANGTTGIVPPVNLRITMANDSFTRANGPLGLPWMVNYGAGSFLQDNGTIFSNDVRQATAGTYSTVAIYNVVTPASQWGQVVIGATHGASSVGHWVRLRYTDTPTMTGYDCAALRNVPGELAKITKRVSGSADVELATTAAGSWADGDALDCEIQPATLPATGATIILSRVVGGVSTPILNYTDTTPISTGKVGIGVYNTIAGDGTIASFAMGTFVTVSADPCGCDSH